MSALDSCSRGYLNKGPAKANSTHPVKVSDLSNAKSTVAFHSAWRQSLGVWELTHKARLPFSCFPQRKPACQLQTLAWAQPSVNTVWQHNIGPPLHLSSTAEYHTLNWPHIYSKQLCLCLVGSRKITCIDLLSQLVRNHNQSCCVYHNN